MRRTAGEPQPCLAAGHLNWVCLSYLGTSIPTIAWREMLEEGGDDGGKTRDTPIERAERIELLKLAQGGIMGTRAYLRYLTVRDQDPAWSQSMVDQVGKVVGDDLLKSTVVVDYLQELGTLQDLLKKTAREPFAPPRFVEALGEPLGDFEARWTAWLLDRSRGLIQRLDAPVAKRKLTADEKKLLAHLDKLRMQTLGSDEYSRLKISEELGGGCRLHAEYLVKYPEQAAAWPDAHEQYPDKEGFTPEGNRAGLSSVIAPGVASGVEAVDAWMATFYHRLPLLDPGLLRVGYALEGGVAVLDVMVGSSSPRRENCSELAT